MFPEFLTERFAQSKAPLTKSELRRLQEEKARKEYEQQFHKGRQRLIRGIGATLLIVAGTITADHQNIPPFDSIDILSFAAAKENTAEQLAARVQTMEKKFRGSDLSDEVTHQEYTHLMAEIFTKMYPSRFTKDDLLNRSNFVEKHEAFVEIFKQKHRPDEYPPSLNLTINSLPRVRAFAKDGQVYFNLEDPFYRRGYFSKDSTYPKDWNSLKSLRMDLGHEWKHLVVEPKDYDPILTLLDPDILHPEKIVEGFRIHNWPMPLAWTFVDLDEAVTEQISIQLNQDLFGSFYSNYISADGRNINLTEISQRLTGIFKATAITNGQIFEMHTQSRLGDFLTLLAVKEGLTKGPEETFLRRGITIAEAVVKNDKPFLTGYLQSVSRKK